MGAIRTIAKAKWWLIPHKTHLKSPQSTQTKALARAQKPQNLWSQTAQKTSQSQSTASLKPDLEWTTKLALIRHQNSHTTAINLVFIAKNMRLNHHLQQK